MDRRPQGGGTEERIERRRLAGPEERPREDIIRATPHERPPIRNLFRVSAVYLYVRRK